MPGLRLKKIKLIIVYLFGMSVILILSMFLVGYLSIKSLKELEQSSLSASNERLQKGVSELILKETEGIAKRYSTLFSGSQYLAHSIANLASNYLKHSNSYSNPDVNIKPLIPSNKTRHAMVNSALNRVGVVYWGSEENFTRNILTSADLTYNLSTFMDTTAEVYPYSDEVWVDMIKNKYVITVPNMNNRITAKPIDLTRQYNKYLRIYRENPNLKNDSIWDLRLIENLNKKKFLSVNYPVFDRKNEFAGFAGINVDIQKIINKISEDIKSGSDTVTMNNSFLLTPETKIIKFPKCFLKLFSLANTERLIDSNQATIRALAERIIKNQKKIFYIDIKNETFLFTVARISENKYIVGKIVPMVKIMQPIQRANARIENIVNKLISNAVLVAVLCILIAIILSAIFFKHLILSPIADLRSAVYEIGKGNFNVDFKVRGLVELRDLSRGIKLLGRALTNYTEDLKHEVKSRQMLDTELEIAAEIQRSVLPKITPKLMRKEYDLDAKLVATKNISGDFYDLFFINDETLAIVLADVSGKGISSAFYMNLAKVVIKNTCLQQQVENPGKILDMVNHSLSRENEAGMFLTMYLAFYNIKTGKLSYANAGHHDIIKIDSGGNISFFGSLCNTLIGLYGDVSYTVSEEYIAVDDIIVFYTDGVNEAINSEGECFGDDRIAEIVRENREKPAKEISDLIIRNVIDFEQNNRFDDITIVVFKRKI